MEIISFVVILLLILLSMKERRELYDRLMSRDFNEFKKYSEEVGTNSKRHLSAHARVIKRWRESK